MEECPKDIEGHEQGFDIVISFFERSSGRLNREHQEPTSYGGGYDRLEPAEPKHICESCQWELLTAMVEADKAERHKRNMKYFENHWGYLTHEVI